MFCVVTFEFSGGGINGIRRRFCGSCEVRKVLLGTSGFYHVTHHCKAGKINWKRIKKAVASHHCLFPHGTAPLQKHKIKLYETSNFRRVSIISVFMDLLRNSKEKTVGLYDEKGLLTRTAATLLPLCNQLVVYTNNSEKYERFCENTRDIFGTAPIVSDDMSVLSEVIAVLSPLGGDYSGFSALIPVFGIKPFEYHISDACISVDSTLTEHKPEAISTLDFLAAVYEKCGVKIHTEDFVKSLCKNGGITSLGGMYYFS